MKARRLKLGALFAALLLPVGCGSQNTPPSPATGIVIPADSASPARNWGPDLLSFMVAADVKGFSAPKYQKPAYFLGACQAMNEAGKGSFMVCPGDMNPLACAADTIAKTLGQDYLWYPVVGNHDAESKTDMAWLHDWAGRGIPHLVRRGPPNGEDTTYSFDVGDTHFVVINEYYDGRTETSDAADVGDALFDWLKADLEANARAHTIVFGHTPIQPLPDAKSGRLRHEGESLDGRPKHCLRFKRLLIEHKVVAFVCGHTHGFSCKNLGGLWQVDAGHCRGIGDKGAPSTFIKFRENAKGWRIEVYRDMNSTGGPYILTQTTELN